jgi:DNA repair protein RAD5
MLKSTYRWCLTGTPIENKLEDLFSLVHFLNLETFGEWFWWNSYINVNGNKDSSSSFELLRQILKPVLLRRTKESTDKEGKDII